MVQLNNKSATTPDAYKAYLMEVLIALAIGESQAGGEKSDLNSVAKKWGVSPSDAASDVTKAKNVLLAVRLFISKAVDDNWNF